MRELTELLIAAAPVMAIALSLVALIYSFYNSKFQGRRDLTVRMFERWSSPAFNEHRSRAFEMFSDSIKDSRDRGSNKEYLVGSPDYIRNFGAIEHFFVDLGRLADSKQLDRKLSRSLFFDNVQFWDGVFSSFEWGEGQQGWEIEVSRYIDRLYFYWGLSRPNIDQRLKRFEMRRN
jgi:hypothetical protein